MGFDRPSGKIVVFHFSSLSANMLRRSILTLCFLLSLTLTLCGDDDLQRAEIALIYQRNTGGWPKNYPTKTPPTDKERQNIIADQSKTDSTIDSGATHEEIRVLAEAFAKSGDARFRDAALRGIQYLLNAQYKNGGWPQYFPLRSNYSRHITFNDNAMIGAMTLLQDAGSCHEDFGFVPQEMKLRCVSAVERGIECVLRCQIKLNGQLTVWCAQHDEVSFVPRKARSYELPSLSGNESVGIVRFLMALDDPNERTVRAIEAAIAWFEQSKLQGIRVVTVEGDEFERGFDRVVVEDPNAQPIWARFYDLQNQRPIFCSRDGIPRANLADISYERRNGYSWLGDYAGWLLEKDWPRWQERIKQAR